jgi:hypothetical protein
VATGNDGSKTPDAAAIALAHGGNPGGRPRADGLSPGSEAAKAADRDKETKRKAEYRARMRAQNPPALPPALPQSNQARNANPDATQPQADDNGAGLESPPLPWDSDALRPLVDELLTTVEQERVTKRTRKAELAGLPSDLLREIEKDSRFPSTAKTTISKTAPPEIARWLEKAGISGQNQNGALLVGAVALIWLKDSRLDAKLDKLIAQRDSARAEEQKKKPSSPLPLP